MKRVIVFIAAIVALLQAPAFIGISYAGEEDSSLYATLWKKLRVVLSEQASRSENKVSAVAGIRGSRQKGDAELQPIWLDAEGKVAKSSKKSETAQLEMLRQAESLTADRQFTRALEVYSEFLGKYPSSEFIPVAEFSIALIYTELSDREKSLKWLDNFIRKYPDHLLTEEAKKVKSTLDE